jgi:hypothetical protein
MRLHLLLPLGPLALAACLPLEHAEPGFEPIAAPQVRHGHRVERIAAGLLMFGGFIRGRSDEAHGQSCYLLVPGDHQWHRCADMLRSRSFFSSVVIDDAVYAIGTDVERYDPARDRWTAITGADLLPDSHFAATAVGRRIFVLGGYPLERSGAFWVDIDTGEVRAAESPPGFLPGDHFHFLATLEGQVHVAGGLDGESFQTQPEHWVLHGSAWKPQTPPPDGLWAKFGGSVVHGQAWFLFGDFGGFRYSSRDGWAPLTGWRDLIAMPALALVGNQIWSFDGLSSGAASGPRLQCYEIATDVWTALPALREASTQESTSGNH